MSSKKKVAYFYDPDIGNYYYGQGHPMKPHRVRMAHDLVLRYELYKQLDIYRPLPADIDAMKAFHKDDYLEFLRHAGPGIPISASEKSKFNIGVDDCPVFDNMFEYCQSYTGGSIGGAVMLNYNKADIVINWAGGLHHAKKGEASGFCYVNDIVLSILELLKYHQRVLYVDIDVHHGDGVEEAFLTTDRVMTVSFHKYGDDFFPGTGDITDVGAGAGKYYAVNVPLKEGMDDASYEGLFKPIINKVMQTFQPGAVVLQSGADSLGNDRLGMFNLSVSGHSMCHEFVKSFNVPLLVVGGGGYRIKNVARCWAYETAVLLGVHDRMQMELPANSYQDNYEPDYSLHPPVPKDVHNANDQASLERIRNTVLRNLDNVRPVGVAMHERAPDAVALDELHRLLPGDRRRQ